MRFKPVSLLGSGVMIAVVAAACGGLGTYKSDFPIVIVNHTANTIQAMANGNTIGTVASGQSGSFTVNLPESNSNTFNNGVAPTPQASVTMSAKDTKTGALSDEKAVTLTAASPTTVAFDGADFPSSGPTVARFTVSPTNPTINQTVQFNGSSSTASNGMYVWDFGDGQTGSGVTATHVYRNSGTFTIVMTVTSDNGSTSTSSRTLSVSGTLAATNANFTFSPTQPSINQAVTFTSSAGTGGAVPTPPGGGGGGTPPGFPGGGGGGFPGIPTPGGGGGGTGSNFIFTWDFGDGSSGSGSPASHTYSRSGTYTVTLRATADTGLSASSSKTITVSSTLPAGSANFTFSPTDPAPGDDVHFNGASSTAASGSSFSWDFGDGNSGSGIAPVHSYSSAHTYTVTLTVTTSLGQTATVSKTVAVAAAP
jgi:PKD repeat protein